MAPRDDKDDDDDDDVLGPPFEVDFEPVLGPEKAPKRARFVDTYRPKR